MTLGVSLQRGVGRLPYSLLHTHAENHLFVASIETGRDSGATRVCDGVSFIRVPALRRGNARAMRVLSMLSYVLGATRATKGLAPPDVIIGSSAEPFAAWIAWRLAGEIRCQ